MKFCKLLHQVESDSASTGRLHFRAVHLIETLEDVLLLLIADSLAVIGYADAQHVVSMVFHLYTQGYGKSNRNRTSVRGELVGVTEEIIDNLAHLVCIKGHEQLGSIRLERQIHLIISQNSERIADIVHEAYDVHTGKRQLLLVLVELAEIQNLVDQIQQSGCITMNQFELSALLRVALIPNHGNKRRDNQGERSSKLVAHIGKEVELQLVHLTGLLDAVFPDLDFILHSLLLYHAAAIVPEDSHNEEQIKNDGPGREIERRMDVNLQPAHLFAHGSVSIHHLHFEHIVA